MVFAKRSFSFLFLLQLLENIQSFHDCHFYSAAHFLTLLDFSLTYAMVAKWFSISEYLHGNEVWQSVFLWVGEGNDNPLQYSCLENPRDREAWWAAIYGIAQSWTWLKWLSSSSSSFESCLKNITFFTEVMRSKKHPVQLPDGWISS